MDDLTITLSLDVASKLSWGGEGDDCDGWTVVRNERIDERRWVSVHELVIERDGVFYAATYEEGLTEHQDTRPWEGEKDAVFHRVEKRTRMVEVVDYVPAEQDGAADG